MPTFQPPRAGVSLSEAYAEALAQAPADDPILHTIELIHPLFVNDFGAATAIRCVRDHADLVATLEADAPLNGGQAVTFTGIPFDFTPPEEGDTGSPPVMMVALDNVSREIAKHMKEATGSLALIEMIYRPYMVSDLTAPHISPPLSMYLRNVKVFLTQVTAEASFGGMSNRRFPAAEYTRDTFPSLSAR